MIKKRKARQKRALAFLLSLCMAFCGFISDVMPVQAAVDVKEALFKERLIGRLVL